MLYQQMGFIQLKLKIINSVIKVKKDILKKCALIYPTSHKLHIDRQAVQADLNVKCNQINYNKDLCEIIQFQPS
jgi:CCR4-NOT transcriptional regulation complex NOT5 subunit